MTDLYSFNALDFADAEPINDNQDYTTPSVSFNYDYQSGSNVETRERGLFDLTKTAMFALVMSVVASIFNAIVMGLVLSLVSSSLPNSFTKSYSYGDAIVLLLRPFSDEYMNEFGKSTATKIIFVIHMVLMGTIALGLVMYLFKNFF